MKRAVLADAAPLPAGVPRPGDVLDRKYRIERAIGRGGMSIVYRAFRLDTEGRVAIKVLSVGSALLPEQAARLEQEASTISRMRSDHVVRVLDRGTFRGIPYIVMELLDGDDLAALLARSGPMPVAFAMQCLLQVTDALAEAHALGVVHRDLKPANLFLTKEADGTPCIKVLDFGISRSFRDAPVTPLTDPGIVVGTPRYMAPEQMEMSNGADPRSDVWSLGAILFELATGSPPYQGDSLPQLLVHIVREKRPRLSAYGVSAASAVERIVSKCLALDPAARFQTVTELADALVAAGRASARREAKASVKLTALASGALLAAVSVCAFVAFETFFAPKPAGAEEHQVPSAMTPASSRDGDAAIDLPVFTHPPEDGVSHDPARIAASCNE